MTVVEPESPPITTIADLLDRLGGIPPERVRMRPPPGSATEKDVIEIEERENRLCELIDGVLVEKTVGYRESLVAVIIARLLGDFVDTKDLGVVTGSDGMMRLFPGLVRIPDVAFVSWDRFPNGAVPEAPIPDVIPNLVVEVLSKGNTKREMRRKLDEYFGVGVQLVWFVDLKPKRTVKVYTAPDDFETFGETAYLTGGDVLPGLRMKVSTLFTKLDRKRSR